MLQTIDFEDLTSSEEEPSTKTEKTHSPQNTNKPNQIKKQILNNPPFHSSEPHWEIPPHINNIFAEAFVGQKIDLRKCATFVNNFEYPYESTASALISLRKPKASVVAHLSGKLTVIGMPSVRAAKVCLRRSARKIQRAVPSASFLCFNVTNLNGSAKVPFGVDLSEVANENKDRAIYNEEVSRSLKFQSGTARFNVFRNGTVTCSSVNEDDFYAGFDAVYELVKGFSFFVDQ